MPSIKSLTVTGYKSISKLEAFPLRDLNVLIGANGAGKSNFIGLFRLLGEIVEERLQLYVQTQGGPDAMLHGGRGLTERLHAEFYFARNGYKFDLVPTSDNRLVFENEQSWFGGQMYPGSYSASLGAGHEESKLRSAQDNYSPHVRGSVTNWRVYHFHDTSERAKVKQKHPANDNLRLKPDAANLAAYLRLLKEKHEPEYLNIVGTIRLVAPFFDDFVHRPGEVETVELEWLQKGNPDTPFKAHMLSDGTLRFICLATLLLQPWYKLPETVLIDEPELGLHPYAIAVLADMFKQVAEKRQLIVSTQSVELLNELTPDDVIVVDQVDGASNFRRYTQDELSGWLEQYSMGELWKRNVLGGATVMVEVVIFAEGPTEEQFIKRLVAPALRHLQVFVKPQMLKTSQEAWGGAINFDRLKFNARNTLRQNPECVLTTLLDLYGLDTSFPGFDEAKTKPDVDGRVKHINAKLHEALVAHVGCRPERFIPHIQPYEFEGLLFSDTAALAQTEPGWSASVYALANVRAAFLTPEHINDSIETKPSRRLEQILRPGYKKTRHGPLAAEKVTLATIENECPHFRGWMASLRNLGGAV